MSSEFRRTSTLDFPPHSRPHAREHKRGHGRRSRRDRENELRGRHSSTRMQVKAWRVKSERSGEWSRAWACLRLPRLLACTEIPNANLVLESERKKVSSASTRSSQPHLFCPLAGARDPGRSTSTRHRLVMSCLRMWFSLITSHTELTNDLSQVCKRLLFTV